MRIVILAVFVVVSGCFHMGCATRGAQERDIAIEELSHEQLVEQAATVANRVMTKAGYDLKSLERSFKQVGELLVFSYVPKNMFTTGNSGTIKISSKTLKVASKVFEQ